MPQLPRRRLRGALVVGAAVLVLAAAAVATVLADPFRAEARKGTDDAPAVSTATVTRRTLTSQTQVDGTLGFAGASSIVNLAHGTVTWLPALGQVISPGQVLYQVDGTPVVLLTGTVPAYRDLGEGATADAVTGADVRQLNAALVALGYATRAQLDPASDEFGWQTKQAVERLQEHLGVEQTGRLSLGQLVFASASVRVTTTPVPVGAPAPPGATILTATSTHRVVSVDLDAAQQSQVKRGDSVTITLPDHETTPGTVSEVGRVATAPSGGQGGDTDTAPTVQVTIALRTPSAAGILDQAPVLVSITTGQARDALVVPVNALLALAGGGYAVEVLAADGTRQLVAVTIGLFDDADGLVQVSGTGLSANQRVVVPAS